MKKVIITGSSRNDGDTKTLTNELLKKSNWDIIDLNDYNFGYYDYKHNYKNDDYLKLMRRIINKYETLIFVTPVYWYSMSGIMKVFFDRLTDLLEIEKDLGQKLQGKNMAGISCSIGNNLGDVFWLPFSETAKYLGMNYLGSLHTITKEINGLELDKFICKIEK